MPTSLHPRQPVGNVSGSSDRSKELASMLISFETGSPPSSSTIGITRIPWAWRRMRRSSNSVGRRGR
eukprot:6720911-Pyramimonas_sp.AAC.1